MNKKVSGSTMGLMALAALTNAPLSHATDYPLLDIKTIRAPFMAACQNMPDNTPLPVDPRTLVVPGVNTNSSAAVQFNAFWVDLHNPAPPYVSTSAPNPTTCGDFRQSVAQGKWLVTSPFFQPFSTTTAYYNLYMQWGYLFRPADFDKQVQQRYGYYPAAWNNPYPYPWEDPNKTNGGSGQLPSGLTQTRDEYGNWTGMISNTCSGCHDSNLGTTSESSFYWGRSNSAVDAGLLQSDLFQANIITIPLMLAPLPWSTGRGTTDAIGIVDFLPALFDMDSLAIAPSLMEYFPTHAAGMTKAPQWSQRAFKTRQFWDGALTSDNVRSEMAFAISNISLSAADRRALTNKFDQIDNFLLSLSPQPYPQTINTTLAQQGAVIFHERDLWANGANATIPKQPGNGSCASCHGVYSPRYANDINYLPDPRLMGIAGVITPIETIGTDPERYSLMLDERKRRAWDTSYLAYNDMAPNHDNSYPSSNLVVSEVNRVGRSAYDNSQGPVASTSPEGPNKWRAPTGYIAPPLYGVWGNAPFFHNGSVPDVWGVLKPSARPAVWARPQTAAGTYGKNKGLDYSYASYDFSKLGWKYTAQTCDPSNWPWDNLFLPCDGQMATIDILFNNIADVIARNLSLAYQSPPPVSDRQIASRMVFNTNLYGNGNQGHQFTQSLTDAERLALIEYMKTL